MHTLLFTSTESLDLVPNTEILSRAVPSSRSPDKTRESGNNLLGKIILRCLRPIFERWKRKGTWIYRISIQRDLFPKTETLYHLDNPYVQLVKLMLLIIIFFKVNLRHLQPTSEEKKIIHLDGLFIHRYYGFILLYRDPIPLVDLMKLALLIIIFSKINPRHFQEKKR